MASAGEHDRSAEGGDHRGTKRDAITALQLPEVVGHLVEIRGRVTDLVTNRIHLVPGREFGHLAIERGRIQDRLLTRTGLVEDAAHRRHEPHVGHAIGFVEHHRLDLGERHDPLTDQILEPAWSGDEQIHTLGQAVDLGLEAHAAVDGQPVAADCRQERGELVGDLAGELAGRRKNQDPGAFLSGRAGSSAIATAGMPNASVFPEPVGARPMTSRPSTRSGMVSAWMVNGW